MDILNNIGFDWQIALINFINFLVIFWLLKKFVFPKLSKTIGDRKEIIEKGLEDADKAKKSLEDAENNRKKIIRDAENKAENIVKKSVSLGKEKESEIINLAQEKSKKIIKDGESKAESRKEAIIKSADKEIVKLAILGAEKILKK